MDNPIVFLYTILFLIFALPAAMVDMKTYRIPDYYVFPGIIALLITMALTRRTLLLGNMLTAVFFTGLFLFIRHHTKGLGLGDVKLAAFVGLYCGPLLSFLAFLIASTSGLIVAFIIRWRSGEKKRPLPFGPFLVLGALVSQILALLLPTLGK